MKIVGADEFELSTGKRFYAHNLIVGLDVTLPESPVSEGYDGGVHWPVPEWWNKEEKEESARHYLTDEEMREVAEFMIEKWDELRMRCAMREK